MTQATAAPLPARGRRGFLIAALPLAAAILCLALGIWQIERRAWKLDLIARVEARLAAAPVPAPGRAAWPEIAPAADEYRRVVARGRFLPDRAVRVMAVTEHGPGFWLLVPLVTAAGDTILINRGFVPAGWHPPPGGEAEPVTVRGLMRMPEPGGAFLRSNDPAADRWFSRDVAAIAAARGLGPVAPFFIDADASANGPGQPIGGLTVVAFRNTHLVYALTWFALSALSAYAVFRLLREPRP
ncbi:SURF1 family protein [Methylobacterium sp. ID0610]|uniref:SURF1 family protein n=1 Tax=Methylobacterium carpenticola TaxID=3344827 RepID=UPI0036A3FB71